MATRISIDKKRCKCCGICIAFCPGKVLDADILGEVKVKELNSCTVCRLCEMRCPDFAIIVEDE